MSQSNFTKQYPDLTCSSERKDLFVQERENAVFLTCLITKKVAPVVGGFLILPLASNHTKREKRTVLAALIMLASLDLTLKWWLENNKKTG